MKSFVTHPLKALNSKDNILHPAGIGPFPSPSATGNGVPDAANSSVGSAASVSPTAMFTTLTLTSACKPCLENRNLGTADKVERGTRACIITSQQACNI